jgi:hypothetical protein
LKRNYGLFQSTGGNMSPEERKKKEKKLLRFFLVRLETQVGDLEYRFQAIPAQDGSEGARDVPEGVRNARRESDARGPAMESLELMSEAEGGWIRRLRLCLQ